MRSIITVLFCLLLGAQSVYAQADFKKLIVGKWQSLDDPNYFEVFTEKEATAEYTGAGSVKMTYTITYDAKTKSHLITRIDPTVTDPMLYSIQRLDDNYLMITYLPVGNTLSYKRVGDNNNAVSTGKLLTVTTTKTFFHSSPDKKTVKKAYLVKGQQVSIWKEQNGFVNATYVNDKGTKTAGWLKKSDLK